MESPLKEQIKRIIDGKNGAAFTVRDVIEAAGKNGNGFKESSFYSAIGRDLVNAGYVDRVGKVAGRRTLFRQWNGAAVDTDPSAPATVYEGADRRVFKYRSGTMAGRFLAVATGLENFSIEYIIHEMEKCGPLSVANVRQSCYELINRLKKVGCITGSGTRPVVYTLAPDFYLYNLHNMINYTDAAPHLEQQIMLNFGKHCGPDRPVIDVVRAPDEPPDKAAVTSKQTAPAPDPPAPAERPDLLQEISKLKEKLDDHTRSIIFLKTRNDDLETKNERSNRLNGRLLEQIEEKQRKNANLQRRLRDAIVELQKMKHNRFGAFSLAELAHLK
jgi:hypothetical protein